MTNSWYAKVYFPLVLVVSAVAMIAWRSTVSADNQTSAPGRQTVVFWHFWGGEDREVVNSIVDRFNESQDEHFVRAIAMPGNNLDLKLFLAVTGGDPPDIVNQDDPILADWAERGAILPLEEIAPPSTIAEMRTWLFPAAVKLGEYRGRLYGLCNGLDVRALYYNQTLLTRLNLKPPTTMKRLDRIVSAMGGPPPRSDRPADHLTRESNESDVREPLGFLPNANMIWGWGIVFGGRFFDEATGLATVDDSAIVAALEWMVGVGNRYGTAAVASRARDQSLSGKSFPLLAGRYAAIVDGQWRVRDLARAVEHSRSQGKTPTQYGVCALPAPAGGRPRAGWINGNYFLVPRGASNTRGAWEFMKFWTGFDGHAVQAARACAAGGWIPVSQQVVDQPEFQTFLADQPLFRTFVELAASPQQIPRPNVPGAHWFDRELRHAATRAMTGSSEQTPAELLRAANLRINQHLRQFRGPR